MSPIVGLGKPAMPPCNAGHVSSVKRVRIVCVARHLGGDGTPADRRCGPENKLRMFKTCLWCRGVYVVGRLNSFIVADLCVVNNFIFKFGLCEMDFDTFGLLSVPGPRGLAKPLVERTGRTSINV